MVTPIKKPARRLVFCEDEAETECLEHITERCPHSTASGNDRSKSEGRDPDERSNASSVIQTG